MCFEELIWLFHSDETTRNIIRINIAEAALLYKIAKRASGDVVEIGRKYGGSSILIASAIPDKNKVYSIDIEENTKVQKNFQLAPKCIVDKIIMLTGDSKEIGKKWDSPISLVFIDGDHSYNGVKTDIKYWIPHVKKDGYAIFHDVIGKKQVLWSLMQNLLNNGWEEVERADSMLCLQRINN